METDLKTLNKPRPIDKETAPDKIGLTMHQLNPGERQMLRTDGYVVVDAVDGIAAESGIQPRDIIIAINNQRISSIKQFRNMMAEVGMRAALLVQRDGNMIFIPLISK